MTFEDTIFWATSFSQKEVAAIYAAGLYNEDRVDWVRVNETIRDRWPNGLARVKRMAHQIKSKARGR